MRKREYESKLNCLKKKIKEEEKKLNSMIFYDDFTAIDVGNKTQYINGIKIALHLIQTHTIAPKARKSNSLQDLHARTYNYIYDYYD